MSDILNIQDVYKVFGHHPDEALRLLEQGKTKDEIFQQTGQTVGVCDASFAVQEGEVFVVMGLSGSGKSTLVRLLNRLIEPTRGKILIQGRDVTKMEKRELIRLRRKEMSMVFQSFALFPHRTVLENACFGLEVSGVNPEERRERALAALDQVGLKPHADTLPGELSGGMQQRVGLARALACDPAILLMDEAFSALDPLIRAEMQEELLRLQEKRARTIVFISHDLDEAIRIGHRIAIMNAGRIVQIGTAEEILRRPADHYVQSFFRGVDVSQVLTAGDIARREQVTVISGHHDDGIHVAVRRLQRTDREYGYVVDRGMKFRGVVSVESLQRALREPRAGLSEAILADFKPVEKETLIGEISTRVAQSPCPVPVVDPTGKFLGTISKTMLLRTIFPEEEKDELAHTAG
jgi:glycine betaine/proline transport system ATP-binding protein